MEATVVSRNRVEIRGGRLKVGKGGWIDIGSDPIVAGRNAACRVPITDNKVSAVHAEFLATEQGVRVRDLGSRNGTFVGGVRVGEVYITTNCKVRLGETEVQIEALKPERVTVPAIPNFGPLVGHCASMRSIFDRLAKVAPTDLTILILGETGTGKELVAQALHGASNRAKKPFIVVDCGSIPPTLAEASLFGHERGSFTGAVDRRISPFLEADGGTIFLDELGELPIDVQPKLLRALSERRIKSVGGNTYKEFDARVICATRRDLVREVNSGGFRSDLYFRVAQVKLEIPSLRQRIEDLPVLVRKMMKDLGDESMTDRVSAPTMEHLMRHDWPGNVRELKNAVQVAFALAQDGEDVDIAAHLGALTEGTAPSLMATGMTATPLRGKQFQEAKREVLMRFERDYFAILHEESKANVSEMARRAGMERAHVRAYLRRHGIGVKGDEAE